jgi:alkylation response protein AidB-like acyl-CoA dehydrogenase
MIFDTALDDVEMTATALAREFAETAGEYDRTAAFPFANIERLRETRLAALVVPREYGAGLMRANRVVNAIARGEASTGLVLAQQYLFHGALRANPGFSPALKDRIFRSASEDGAFGNSLRVEPELGTPIRGGLPATVARRTANGWALSGRKIYATGSPVLTWNAIWARTDEAEPRVGPFIVPAGAPGLAIEETWRQLGMRASGSQDVLLDNVEIPFDHAADLKTLHELTGPDAMQMAWVAVLFSTIYDGAARGAGLVRQIPARTGADQSRRAACDLAAHAAGGRRDRFGPVREPHSARLDRRAGRSGRDAASAGEPLRQA